MDEITRFLDHINLRIAKDLAVYGIDVSAAKKNWLRLEVSKGDDDKLEFRVMYEAQAVGGFTVCSKSAEKAATHVIDALLSTLLSTSVIYDNTPTWDIIAKYNKTKSGYNFILMNIFNFEKKI